MKTDPTLGISGVAGMPLSQAAIQSGKRSAAGVNNDAGKRQAISDTLETSDRDPDGQQPWKSAAHSVNDQAAGSDGDLLDLTG